MTGAMTGFLVAVGATSAVCYALMTRLQNRRARGEPSRGGSHGDAGNYPGYDGLGVANWSVTHYSTTDGSGNPIDGGSTDSGGGSDGSSGGDGGGGGD
jgi:hypothetical protein